MPHLGRRAALFGGAAVLAAAHAMARVVKGELPWEPYAGEPPAPIGPGHWRFFTPEEGAAVEALVDRLIPPDPETPGGRDAGVAVFIDRQLAGPYGTSVALYMRPPFKDGTASQGFQSPQVPAARYRLALRGIDAHCRAAFAGRPLAQLTAEQQDKVIHGLERNEIQLPQTSAKGFFELLLKDTKEGFFSDPVYGGNRDMCAWKMIGFPGARYDYRDWVERHNEKYPHPPVSIGGGRPEWTPAPARG